MASCVTTMINNFFPPVLDLREKAFAHHIPTSCLSILSFGLDGGGKRTIHMAHTWRPLALYSNVFGPTYVFMYATSLRGGDWWPRSLV